MAMRMMSMMSGTPKLRRRDEDTSASKDALDIYYSNIRRMGSHTSGKTGLQTWNLLNAYLARCEHYHRSTDLDHFVNHDIGQGQFETRYLEALFLNDTETILAYEEHAASEYGTGPRAVCSSVSNFSTNKVNCCE